MKPTQPQSITDWLNSEDDSWRPMLSYFQAPISNVLPSEEISLLEVHRRITGERYAGITQKLRDLKHPRVALVAADMNLVNAAIVHRSKLNTGKLLNILKGRQGVTGLYTPMGAPGATDDDSRTLGNA